MSESVRRIAFWRKPRTRRKMPKTRLRLTWMLLSSSILECSALAFFGSIYTRIGLYQCGVSVALVFSSFYGSKSKRFPYFNLIVSAFAPRTSGGEALWPTKAPTTAARLEDGIEIDFLSVGVSILSVSAQYQTPKYPFVSRHPPLRG